LHRLRHQISDGSGDMGKVSFIFSKLLLVCLISLIPYYAKSHQISCTEYECKAHQCRYNIVFYGPDHRYGYSWAKEKGFLYCGGNTKLNLVFRQSEISSNQSNPNLLHCGLNGRIFQVDVKKEKWWSWLNNNLVASGNCYDFKKSGLSGSDTLKDGFIMLSNQRRLAVQSNLSSLGYYQSSIDGIYGSNTRAALLSYNKNKLGNLDVNQKDNIDILLTSILAIKTSN